MPTAVVGKSLSQIFRAGEVLDGFWWVMYASAHKNPFEGIVNLGTELKD
jgi:hypothetical protein